MGECVALISRNKLRVNQMYEYLKKFDCSVITCESIESFIKYFNAHSVGCYVLDLQNNKGEMDAEFLNFYTAFLNFVPEEMRIVIGSNKNDPKQIAFENFNNAFSEKYAYRMLKGSPHKLMSLERASRLARQIEKFLLDNRFSPKYCGFDYVIDILYFYLTTSKSRVVLSKDVYPMISKKYGKTQCSIERNIRFFLHGNKDFCKKVLDENYSTKRIIELLYRDVRKDFFIEKIMSDPD